MASPIVAATDAPLDSRNLGRMDGRDGRAGEALPLDLVRKTVEEKSP